MTADASPSRTCATCGFPLIRRHGEGPLKWRGRKFCNRRCAHIATATARRRPTDRWPPEKLARLRTLVEGGTPYRRLARELGISLGAAIGRAWRSGFAPQPDAPLTRAQIGRRQAADSCLATRLPPGCPPPQAVEYAIAAFEALGHGCCAWPEGGPDTAGFRFCGAATDRPGKSYCAEHRQRAGGLYL